MKTRWLLLGSLVLGLVAAPAPAEEKKPEAKPMKFKYISIVQDGEAVPEKEVAAMTLTVGTDGKGVVMKGKKVFAEGTSKMDMTKTPWEIDVTMTKGEHKGKVIKGIMKAEEKKMTICFAAPGKDRPTEFKSEKGSGNTLEVLEAIEEK
jgi:uncharacterized protein (TIGR03067 family)